MKKLLLSILISATMLSSSMVSADEATPLAYVKDKSGNWTVSGFNSGSDYASAQISRIEEEREKRKKDIANSSRTDKEKEVLSAQVDAEFDATIARFEAYGEEADIALKLIKSGKPISIAKNEASDQYQAANGGFKDTYDPNDSSTSYNSGSVTDNLMSGSDAPLVKNNQFKQFNELDCSYEEVAQYADRTKEQKTKAFSTSPSFSNTFKKTATKSAKKLKEGDEAECQTIFHDINFEELPDLSISNISSGLPTFGDFGDMMNDMGNKAGEQLGGLVDDLYSVLREGFCARLSSDYVGELAGDLIDDEYKSSTKDTSLEGTKINKLDSESGQNNFTYKVIKNQTEMSDSNLIKAIDVTRDDQSKYQEKHLEGELDDVLDDLEDELFG